MGSLLIVHSASKVITRKDATQRSISFILIITQSFQNVIVSRINMIWVQNNIHNLIWLRVKLN